MFWKSSYVSRVGFQLREKRSERLLTKEKRNMLWSIFVVLLILWVLGLVTSYTFGGFVHILLVIAVVVLLFQLIAGRRIA